SGRSPYCLRRCPGWRRRSSWPSGPAPHPPGLPRRGMHRPGRRPPRSPGSPWRPSGSASLTRSQWRSPAWARPRRARPPPGPARLAVRIGLFCLLAAFQCVILLAIVHWGVSLKGPKLPMLAVLGLASAVGVALGSAVLSLFGTARPVVVLAPLTLLVLAMWG